MRAKLTQIVAAPASVKPAGYQFPASGTRPGRLLKVSPQSDRLLGVRLGGTVASTVNLRSPNSPGPGNWTWAPSTRRVAERSAHGLTIPAPASTPRACLQRSLAALGRLAWLEVLVSMSLAPERCPTPARPITPMVKNSSTNCSYQREPPWLKVLLKIRIEGYSPSRRGRRIGFAAKAQAARAESWIAPRGARRLAARARRKRRPDCIKSCQHLKATEAIQK